MAPHNRSKPDSANLFSILHFPSVQTFKRSLKLLWASVSSSAKYRGVRGWWGEPDNLEEHSAETLGCDYGKMLLSDNRVTLRR